MPHAQTSEQVNTFLEILQHSLQSLILFFARCRIEYLNLCNIDRPYTANRTVFRKRGCADDWLFGMCILEYRPYDKLNKYKGSLYIIFTSFQTIVRMIPVDKIAT